VQLDFLKTMIFSFSWLKFNTQGIILIEVLRDKTKTVLSRNRAYLTTVIFQQVLYKPTKLKSKLL